MRRRVIWKKPVAVVMKVVRMVRIVTKVMSKVVKAADCY